MSNILLVDDTPDFRISLSGLLIDNGHVVYTAESESEALAAISQADFHFALIDVRLHDGGEEDESGIMLAWALRELRPRVHVILLTRFVRSRQIVRAVRLYGVMDFVDKTNPDYAEQLLNILSDAKRARSNNWQETIRLSVALASDQHIYARATGQYVCATRSSQQLKTNIERLTHRASTVLRDLEHFRAEASDIGDDLWREVIGNHAEINNIYREATTGEQRLILSFELPRQQAALPLEFIRSNRPADYLVLQHPVSRFIQDVAPKRPAISPQLLATVNRVKMLLIASNTVPDIPGVDWEVHHLAQRISEKYGWVSTTVVSTNEMTYIKAQEVLSANEYDIIHYAGHGWYETKSTEDSSLFFWSERNRQGEIVELKAAELSLLLGQSRARLVFFSCCNGASSGDQGNLVKDDFLGLADATVQAGVPTVIGYRCAVRDSSAPLLAETFYESLFEQGRPEIALWRARQRIAVDRNDPAWLSPILIHQA